MKRLLVCLVFCFGILSAQAQLNNEWIDYGKVYYKFNVAHNGIHRIPYTVLQAAGLSNVPMEQFQLFRNGKEVPLFTSRITGVPETNDYIEFLGQQNDGNPDTKLYKEVNWQLNSTYSLFTDTASYFLTVNPLGTAERFTTESNDLTNNRLSPEPFFTYTFVKAFKNKINLGNALVSGGLYIYSSSYEQGEGWTSRDIFPGSPLTESYSLYPAAVNASATLSISFSGNTPNTRNVEVLLNDRSLFDESLQGFSVQQRQVSFPMNYFGNTNAEAVTIRNKSTIGSDRIVSGEIKITYPRLFNFGGANLFEFSLPANNAGNYLEISNFNAGSSAPVLLDLTNRKRYVGIVSNNLVRFLLKPSSTSRNLVLLSMASPVTVSSLENRIFTDFRKAAAQGDYLIISHKKLMQSTSGDPVENYRAYRASASGGGFNAKVLDISELIDQYGFGIRWNPFGIKNFIQFARTQFSIKPKYIFLLGRGFLYNDARLNEQFASTHEMNMVPTYGSPGSDNLLVSSGYDVNVDIPVGRLAAISGEEVALYLQKVKQHESGKIAAANTINDRKWRKNIVHAIGGNDPFLQAILTSYMNGYKSIAQDTLLGADVHSFSKSVNINADLLTADQLSRIFEEGISLLTYFGHSAIDILEFNIDDPETYNNPGKYPFFLVNGCYAGNIFIYDTARIKGIGLTLSEKYMFAKERGGIGFLANSHVGVVNYLNVFTEGLYRSISRDQYGKAYGDVVKATLLKFSNALSNVDYLGQTHKEQMVLHADPAIASNGYALPDYVVEDPMVKISPSPLSVADNEFKLAIRFANIGKAVNDSIRVLVQRRLPNGNIVDIFNKRIKATLSEDSLLFTLSINPITDKGTSRILVTLDADNKVVEQSELNNSVVKDFNIVEDEIRPVYPLKYAIHNQPVNYFYASIANPLSPSRMYVIEVDTTELFNSSTKQSAIIQGQGGLVKFNPTGISWKDSTVYYWRTAPQSTSVPNWSTSSFMYLRNNPNGFGQAHYDQHSKSTYEKVRLNEDRQFYFDTSSKKFVVKNGLFPYYSSNKIIVTLDETLVANYGCRYSSLQIVVLDAKTLKPWTNSAQSNGFGSYGSCSPCSHNARAFEFPYADPVYRRNAVAFLESLPNNVIVSISNFARIENQSFIGDWMNDTITLGRNRSLYHSLKRLGFSVIDNFTKNLPFIFVARKNGNIIKQVIGASEFDYLDETILLRAFSTAGSIKSPWLGPATQWTRMKWNGIAANPLTDVYTVQLYGKDNTGQEQLLLTTKNIDTSVSFIDAKKYPYLRMQLNTIDTVTATPYQLKYWILTGVFPPEGAIAAEPGKNVKDTVEAGEVYPFEMAFKNISTTAFDSLEVRLSLTNASNVTTVFPMKKFRPIKEGDTVVVRQLIDTRKLSKDNLIFLNVNPEGVQPEQYLFNNFLYKSIYVKPDEYKPVLDVTFDGARILSEDIVSAKPHILIKLTDNNKFLMLDDTSLLSVKVRYPNNQVRVYRFDSDTVRFTPAVFSSGGKENVATIDFMPFFKEDGTYELIVTGTDKSGNATSFIEYKVAFKVMNKPMISELLNYPNPFTSSTAFVFTLTGAQVPQNMRIQILTITGKIVREITKEELGPIRIGRNITEYKWDGTDQYGQKLANGVYLYRVITNLNGHSLEKIDGKAGINTVDQKYFNNGYGKMYLMR